MTHEDRLALIMLPFPVVHICGSAKSWTGATIRGPLHAEAGYHIGSKSIEGGHEYLYWADTDNLTEDR